MRLQGLFKFVGPILLTLLAMALANNRMDVKAEQLVTHGEQGQYIGYRQSKWLEKFKRPKPSKSHYGKPKAYFNAPKPQYSAPVTTHYTPPQVNYYENPTPYKSQYHAQPSYVPSAARPTQANYFPNPSLYNQHQAVYRTPAGNPSHPSFSKPEPQNNLPAPVYQEPGNSNPAQPPSNYIPSQPVNPSVNNNPTQPLFGPSGPVNVPVHSETEDYRNQVNIQPSSQPISDYVPSHPVNPAPAVYVPPVTNNQQEPYSHSEPAIITPLKDYKETINNNQPQFAFSNPEPVNDSSVQNYRAPVNEEPQQHSLDYIPSEPVNPSVYQSPVENNPGPLPFSHTEPENDSPLSNYEELVELVNNNPLQLSYSQPEPVNQPQPSYGHHEPTNNSPQGLGEQDIDNPPQPPHGHQEFANSPQPAHSHQEFANNPPQPHSHQPAHSHQEFANSPPPPHSPQPAHSHQEFANSPQPPHSPQPAHSHQEFANSPPPPHNPQPAHSHQEFANSPPQPHSPQPAHSHQEFANSPQPPHSPQPAHSHQEFENSQPLSGHSEQVNNDLPQPFYAQHEAIPNHPEPSPFGHSNPINNRPPVPNNPLQSFYNQQGPVNNPQLSYYTALVKNNPPQPSLDYIPSEPSYSQEETAFDQTHPVQELQQPAHTEAPQSTSKPLSHNVVPAQDSFFPTEATSSSTSSPVIPIENEAPLNFPDSPFSTDIEDETHPLFYNEFQKSERNQEDPDTGFFEFGIFPRSNSFFLQNYRG